MIDTQTADLLAVIHDALTLPAATDTGRADRERLERVRADAVRQAVHHALATGDLASAVDLLDTAIAASPIDRVCVPHQRTVAR
ncbi:hypothetical protein BJF83_18710 [Nocardiopsis sp. CNR-923]|uniref:hypothetical protein n=1 Tax=Nocardiopsis sp. CNR-923 TaxID=1904965 RepID=UPI00095D1219|nr:hypothetical protein [Nocardiopsis sp. CNR-923]OLT27217.1 hypothetical protein BJF83_18710 [Nocardiopsis sp. CNR-923]